MEIIVEHLLDFMLRIEAFPTYHIVGDYSSVTIILYRAPRDFKAFRHLLVVKETYASQYRMVAISDNANGFKCLFCPCSDCYNPHIRFCDYVIPHRLHG